MAWFKRFRKYLSASKRSKRSLRRDLDKTARYISEQSRTCAERALRSSKYVLAIFAFTVLALVAGSYGQELHKAYLMKSVGDYVYKITPRGEWNRGGTGFLLQVPGGNRIISNAHVCAGSRDGYMDIHMTKNRLILTAKILKVNKKADLCMLTGLPNLSGLTMAEAAPVSNQWVGVIGHAALLPLTFSSGEVLELTVTTVGSYKDPKACKNEGGKSVPFIFGFICLMQHTAYQTTAKTYGGNSGSPMFDKAGRVLGVVFASSRGTHFGLVVPHTYLKEFIKASSD